MRTLALLLLAPSELAVQIWVWGVVAVVVLAEVLR